MKQLLIVSFTLVSVFCLSQNKLEPVLALNINADYFNTVYNKLDAITKSIVGNTYVISYMDDIRQGQLFIVPDNIGKPFNNIKIANQPNLDLQLERILYTGNFPNPRLNNIPNIKH